MASSIKGLTKLQTFNRLLIETASALDAVDDYDLTDNFVSEMTFTQLQELQSLRSIALINFIMLNAELLIVELVEDISA